jgi:hypothetical protein
MVTYLEYVTADNVEQSQLLLLQRSLLLDYDSEVHPAKPLVRGQAESVSRASDCRDESRQW